MYSDTAADGGSLFGGGGFMPSQNVGPTSDPFPGGGTTKRNTQNSGLLPLTVKQLSTAEQRPADDNFYVDGQEVNNVTLVGMVVDKVEKATDISFYLDDLTGRVEVKKWIDGQDSEELVELRNLRPECYVRVHGHLRSFQGKRNIVGFSVRAIEDFNEVAFHFLECIFVHVSQTTKARGGSFAFKSAANTQNHANTPSLNTARNTNSYSQAAIQPATMVGANLEEECQKRVQAIFEDPASMRSDVGLHRNDVYSKMVGFSQKQVRDAIEFLVMEGLIYSTIDDDHYKSASC